MSQTSAVAASLIIAFIVFITVRSQLPCYLKVLGVGAGAGCPSSTAAGTATATNASTSGQVPLSTALSNFYRDYNLSPGGGFLSDFESFIGGVATLPAGGFGARL